jgi:hypothetical protein
MAVAGSMVAADSTEAVVEGRLRYITISAVSRHLLIKENKIMQHRMIERFDTFQWLGRITTVAVGAILLVMSSATLSLAQKSTQETYPSAEEAGHALFVAVQSDNEQAVTKILGGGKELVSSADDVEDKLEREQFARKYQEMHRLVREPDGTTVLYVGAENWPFPIPLASKSGAWYFDSDAGAQEILFRRIGENEATAIEICHALVRARKHAATTSTTTNDSISEYAQTLVSAHETNAGNSASASKEETSGPLQGYYFRVLDAPRKNSSGAKDNVSDASATAGYTVIAYPTDYRSSGVMTFIVTPNDVVYEKDLGPNTAKLAKKMTARTPSAGWHPAE